MPRRTWRTRVAAFLAMVAARLQGPDAGQSFDRLADQPDEAESLWSAKLQAAVGADLTECVLVAGDAAAGQTLRQVDLPEDCVVVSIHRGSKVVPPRGHTSLQVGDRLIILKTATSCDDLRAVLRRGSKETAPAQQEESA